MFKQFSKPADKTKPMPGFKVLTALPLLAYIVVSFAFANNVFIGNVSLLVLCAIEIVVTAVNVGYRTKRGGYFDRVDLMMFVLATVAAAVVITRMVKG